MLRVRGRGRKELLFLIVGRQRKKYHFSIADNTGLKIIFNCSFTQRFGFFPTALRFRLLRSEETCRRVEGLRVEALNHALEGIPQEQIRYHICWGNFEGPHTHDVALRDIIDLVLKVRAGAYVVEACNPRHAHEWQVWQDVKLPPGKILITGVIDTTTNFVEHPELVAQRLEQYARVVGRENVIGGTDCGFGTFAGRDRVYQDVTWAKLKSLVEGARIASKRLWG